MIEFSGVRRWGRRVAGSLGILNLLDRRDRQRVKADFRAILSGPCGLVQARGLDATRRGIGVLATHPLEKGMLVFAEIVELSTGGFAYVRRCDPKGDGTYSIGLQFCKELDTNGPKIGSWECHHFKYGPFGAWDSALGSD
jgi:hypothetical protein